ncbi:hypothetical protein BB558_004175 [Smittium angustum]|uniref:Uncharacterized protein n=1 Tax=Smittium angustum TaxID=133377 RepID=A0A2U1J416_SMIAN|nr:hypothetical protein BB558_004175 [Smittium angustum]
METKSRISIWITKCKLRFNILETKDSAKIGVVKGYNNVLKFLEEHIILVNFVGAILQLATTFVMIFGPIILENSKSINKFKYLRKFGLLETFTQYLTLTTPIQYYFLLQMVVQTTFLTFCIYSTTKNNNIYLDLHLLPTANSLFSTINTVLISLGHFTIGSLFKASGCLVTTLIYIKLNKYVPYTSVIVYLCVHVPFSIQLGYELCSTATVIYTGVVYMIHGNKLGWGLGYIKNGEVNMRTFGIDSSGQSGVIVAVILIFLCLISLTSTVFHQRRDFVVSFMIFIYFVCVSIQNMGYVAYGGTLHTQQKNMDDQSGCFINDIDEFDIYMFWICLVSSNIYREEKIK